MQVIKLTIPLVPPSVNHYKDPIPHQYHQDGRKKYRYSAEAKAWFDAVAIFARGESMGEEHKHFEVEYKIYFGKGQKGDVDNFSKVIFDGIEKARIIKSDAKITDFIGRKRRDVNNPRTEIFVRPTSGEDE